MKPPSRGGQGQGQTQAGGASPVSPGGSPSHCRSRFASRLGRGQACLGCTAGLSGVGAAEQQVDGRAPQPELKQQKLGPEDPPPSLTAHHVGEPPADECLSSTLSSTVYFTPQNPSAFLKSSLVEPFS